MVQWSRLHASTADGAGLTPGRGTKILHAVQPKRGKKWYPVLKTVAAKSLQLCPTLCDPIDGSLQGFPVPGILQARTVEWVAISFSNA